MKPRVFVWLGVKCLGVYFIVYALKVAVPLVVIVVERMVEVKLFDYRHPYKSLAALADVFYPLLGSVKIILTVGLMLFFGAICFRKSGRIVNRVCPRDAMYCAECGYDVSNAIEVLCKECGSPIIRGSEAKT